jgi:hypothetical protein
VKFKITENHLTGNPDPSGWVGCHDFTPVSDETLLEKGRLVIISSMLPKNGSALPANQNLVVSREVLTRFHEEYYNQKGSAFELLSKAVENISKDFSSPNESLQILAAIFLENRVLIASRGKLEAWVVRRNEVAKIIGVGDEVKVANGPIEIGDSFLFGTATFFSKVTPDVIKTPSSLPSFSAPESDFGVINIKIENAEQVEVAQVNLPQINNSKPSISSPMMPMPKKISPVRIALAKGIDKIIAILPDKKGYIKEEIGEPQSNKKRKIATWVGAILLALLVVSIIFGMKQQKNLSLKSRYEPVLTSAQHNLDEAKSLSSIDESRARDLILNAKSQVDGLKSQKIVDPRIDVLSREITEALGSIAGVYDEAPELYLDLTLQSSGFKGDDIAVSDERMVVLDRAGKRLISTDIGTKKTIPVAGPDIMPNAISVAAYSDRNFVSSNNGIWEVNSDKANVILPQDKDLSSNILISAYTGNLYVLDKSSSILWRYQGDGGAFAAKQNWFGAGIKPDLSGVIAWTIDGNMWMLTENNDILRFSGGSPIDFSLKNMDKDLNAVDIFTTQDSSYLYLLDKGNGRVLVVDKDGNYKAQYISDNIKTATKIVVSETDKKMILLEGDKLYSLDIKHL